MSRLGYHPLSRYQRRVPLARLQRISIIVWRVGLTIAYSGSCLGTHFIAPPLDAPKAREAPWEWAEWTVARIFNAGILGYSDDDFAALKRARSTSEPSSPAQAADASDKDRGKGKEAGKVATSALNGIGGTASACVSPLRSRTRSATRQRVCWCSFSRGCGF